jgi:hypothetical protein
LGESYKVSTTIIITTINIKSCQWLVVFILIQQLSLPDDNHSRSLLVVTFPLGFQFYPVELVAYTQILNIKWVSGFPEKSGIRYGFNVKNFIFLPKLLSFLSKILCTCKINCNNRFFSNHPWIMSWGNYSCVTRTKFLFCSITHYHF